MKKIGLFSIFLIIFFSLSFVFAEQMGWIDDQTVTLIFHRIQSSSFGRLGIFITVIILLTSDILLPIPSSLVMILSGNILGLTLGASANFLGCSLCAILSYELCRGSWKDRYLNTIADDSQKMKIWLNRNAFWAILISRPLPMMTELVSCLAGLSAMDRKKYYTASTLGNIPLACAYAWTGQQGNTELAWLILICVITGPILLGYWLRKFI